jgi:fluoride exporter
VEGKLSEPSHTAADGFCQALAGTESSGMQEPSPDRAVPPAAGVAAATAVTGRSPGSPAGSRVRRIRWVRSDVDRREIAAIFAGGALGTLARTALADAFPRSPTAWPWPTFAVNIVAAFGLGYFVTRLTERLPLSSYRRPLLGTGLCGGLSTFSTMQVEILKMVDAHAWALTAGYAAASVAAGYAAIQLATAMVRRVRVQVRR